MSRTIELLTYADLRDHLIDFTSANPSPQKVRQTRTAIREAYKNFRNSHNWPYYYKMGRICTVKPYDIGTVVYTVTGGSVEREVALTSGTWPAWSAYGRLLIGSVYYDVADRISNTVLQLDINEAPDSDIASTSYTIVRDTYTLPSDFVNLDRLYTPESWHSLEYVHPRVWLGAHSFNVTSASSPSIYTVRGSPDFMGAMSISFYPYPDSEQTISFVYQRQGRPLRIERDLGVCNADAEDSYANYEEGTTFKQEHVGAVIRVSDSNADEYPSGRQGTNPYDEERVIMSVNSDGDQIEIDQAWENVHTNAKFTISDPVDIEPGIMTAGLLRCCEKEIAIITRMEDRAAISAIYAQYLIQHKEYAQPIQQPRQVGSGGGMGRRLAYMPEGADVD